MRLLVLLLLALSLATPAVAQDTNETPDENASAEGNGTADEGAGGEPATAGTGSEGEADDAGPITIEMEAHQQGSALYFTLKGETARNPTIRVQPGQQVTFILTVVSGVHNLNINGEAQTPIIGEGVADPIVWTAPAEGGTVEYWCDPHRGAGMRGNVAIGGSDAGAGGGEDEGTITGQTIDLGQFDPACEGRVAPAIVREGIVGAPTLQDYIDGCKAQTEGGEDTSHPADYVIPVSWLLIGIGVVGVVWVHKYYKP